MDSSTLARTLSAGAALITLLTACSSHSLDPLQPGSGGEGAGSGKESAAPSAGVGGESGATPEEGISSDVSSASENGWLDELDDSLGIHGSVYIETDPFVAQSIQVSVTSSDLCVSGTAQVDLKCEPTEPGSDCFGLYFGTRIGIALNQGSDGEKAPVALSTVTGFEFEIVGKDLASLSFGLLAPDVPRELWSGLPSMESSQVRTLESFYCHRVEEPGTSTIGLNQLSALCHKSASSYPLQVDGAQALALVWWVRGPYDRPGAFDFCIRHVRALPQ